jgi:hypothetical protein
MLLRNCVLGVRSFEATDRPHLQISMGRNNPQLRRRENLKTRKLLARFLRPWFNYAGWMFV